MNAFGHLTVASSLHDRAAIDHITAPARAAMHELGGAALDVPEDQPDRPLVILVATGGTEAAVLDVVARRHAVVPFEPVILVAHRLHNSLPAALESLARLRQDGHTGRIVQSDDEHPDELAVAITDVAAVHRLHQTRLGLVGAPSNWLVASVPDAHVLRSRWGIELVDVDITRTIRDHRAVDADTAHAVAVTFLSRTHAAAEHDGHLDVTPELATAAAVHPALVDTIARDRLDAVAVRCFDFLTDLTTSGCVALAELNDTGTVAGCEGDVAGTVAMLLVRSLLDQPSWIANPAYIDTDRDQLLLAHCTVAPSMVERVDIHTHFESGLGIGLRGWFRPGPVTLLRLGGASLERHWVVDGAIVATGASPDLCRTQVTVQLGGGRAADLLDDPLGNHVVLVHGHHARRIERWWKLAFPVRAGQPVNAGSR